MEYSSKQSQEKRRGFIDPRTKLALVLILALQRRNAQNESGKEIT